MDIRAILLEEVKKKNEFSTLPDTLILETVEKVLKKFPKVEITPHQIKILVKEIRALLHRSTGMFQKGKTGKKRKGVLDAQELLKTHLSTYERTDFYQLIKEKIKSLGIKSILDIGCGLNPLALASPELLYNACDIRQDEIDIINNYFKSHGIEGHAFVFDIRKFNSDLPKADLCLLWKIIEIVGGDTHRLTRSLLNGLDCKYIIVSFSTVTLSGKNMRRKRRTWFEKIVLEENLAFDIFETTNEIFYIIKKAKNQ
ncbi:hypothetical protein FJZ18_04445 [Candidatus Pacearchaeota archaeon]|nr:hypothetical protein [Candidatus Pacearchaeota archaeon]